MLYILLIVLFLFSFSFIHNKHNKHNKHYNMNKIELKNI